MMPSEFVIGEDATDRACDYRGGVGERDHRAALQNPDQARAVIF
jgi:hypothetical protein